MSYRDYIATTSATGDVLLADWRWCLASVHELWLVTTWGDAILRDRDDGSIHLLDTTSAELLSIARDAAAFEEALTSPATRDEWLRASLVDRQRRLGMSPRVDECFGFRIPPAVGGAFDAGNVEIQSIPVHFAITGQLLAELRAAKPGARLVGMTVDSEGSPLRNARPWWRFW